MKAERGAFLGFHLDKWATTLQFDESFRGPTGEIAGYFQYCTEKVLIDGAWLEFGVCTGRTIRQLSELMPSGKIMYGFDSFQGLPEDWDLGAGSRSSAGGVTLAGGFFHKGETFGTIPGEIPSISNCQMVVGLFEETLPAFVKSLSVPVALVHIDCDLYSSTKTVFKYLEHKIIPGTVILFDEFYNYTNYLDGEYKAFREFIDKTKYNFEVLATTDGQQLAVRILPSDFKIVNEFTIDDIDIAKRRKNEVI